MNEFNKAHDAYRYLPQLEKYRGFFGSLNISDILGVGNNGFVVRHPASPDWAVKLPHPGNVDSIRDEIRNHTDVLISLEKFKRESDESESVAVPDIDTGKLAKPEGGMVLSIVHGQSLHTKMLLDLPEYAAVFAKLGIGHDDMTDYEVYRTLADNHLFGAEYLDMAIRWPQSIEFVRKFIDSHPEVKKALDRLEASGVGHADLHGGNIMLGKDGKTYLIDFGRMRRKTEK